jgi:hypothetical protein
VAQVRLYHYSPVLRPQCCLCSFWVIKGLLEEGCVDDVGACDEVREVGVGVLGLAVMSDFDIVSDHYHEKT